MEPMYNLVNKKWDSKNQKIVDGFDILVNIKPLSHKQAVTIKSKFNVHQSRVFVIEEIK